MEDVPADLVVRCGAARAGRRDVRLAHGLDAQALGAEECGQLGHEVRLPRARHAEAQEALAVGDAPPGILGRLVAPGGRAGGGAEALGLWGFAGANVSRSPSVALATLKAGSPLSAAGRAQSRPNLSAPGLRRWRRPARSRMARVGSPSPSGPLPRFSER